VALPVVISEGIEWPVASLPMIGPESAGTEVPGTVAACQSASKIGSDAISMMFTVAQVAPINLA
jgi:hypothetical protein